MKEKPIKPAPVMPAMPAVEPPLATLTDAPPVAKVERAVAFTERTTTGGVLVVEAILGPAPGTSRRLADGTIREDH